MIRFVSIYLDRVGTRSARAKDQKIQLTDPSTNEPVPSLLWLRNGGGKTTILSLLFSLFLPDARHFIWTKTENRTLGDYVLSGDTSLVAAEVVTPTGPVVVAGYYEWPDRVRPSDYTTRSSDLDRIWVVFSPMLSAMTIDTLPRVSESGHLLTLRESRSQLEQTAKATPALRLSVCRTQTEFATALDSHGVDTGLLKAQLPAMGQEGGFEKMFATGSNGAFVNQMVDLLYDENSATLLSDRITASASDLASLPRLRLEQKFSNEMSSHLSIVASAAEELADVAAKATEMRAAADDLAATLTENDSLAEASAGKARAESDAVAHSVPALYAARTAAQLRLQAYQHREATLRVDEAEARLSSLTAQRDTAHLESEAWYNVEQVVAVTNARAALSELEARQLELETGAAPQRAALDRAAGSYLARLQLLAAETQIELTQAEHELTAALELISTVHAAQTAVEEERVGVLAEQLRVTSELGQIEVDVALVRGEGVLAEAETPDEATTRTAKEQELAIRAVAEHQSSVEAAEALQAALECSIETKSAELDEARASERIASETATKMQTMGNTLASDETIRALVGADEVDMWAARSILESAVQARLNSLELTVATTAFELERIERVLAVLSDSEILPPTPSIERVINSLALSGIPATSGYEYLSRSVPRRLWAQIIESRPEACAGVVVEDCDVTRARDSLAGMHLEGLVVVAPKAVFVVDESYERVVLAPLVAVYDPQASPAVRDALKIEAASNATVRASTQQEISTTRHLSGQISDFFDLVPTRDRLSAALSSRDESIASVASLTQEVMALRAESATTRVRVTSLRELITSETARAHLAGLALSRLAPLARRWATVPDLLQRSGELTSEVARLAGEVARLSSVAKAAEQDRLVATDTIARRSRDIEKYEAEQADVGNVPLGDALVGTSLDALRRSWRLAIDELHVAVTDAELAGQITSARQRVAEGQERLTGVSPAVLARAEHLSVTSPDAAVADARRLRAAQARDADANLTVEVKTASDNLTKCGTQLAEHPPTDESVSETDPRVVAQVILDSTSEISQLSTEASAAEKRRDDLRTQSDAYLAEHEKFRVALESLAAQDVDATRGTSFEWDPSQEPSSVTNAMLKSLRAIEKQQAALAGSHSQLVQRAVGLPRDLAYVDLDRSITSTLSYLTAEVLSDVAEATRQASVWLDRAAAATGVIDRLEQHLQICTDDVAGEVTLMLDRFERVASVSKMPAGLGDWSEQPFLRFRFDSVRDDQLALKTHVRDAIDSVIQGSKGASINGLDVLKAAIRAAVPKGFRITVMKPSPELNADRYSVTELSSWSGGERLTSAVVLFCVIAALRADARGSRDYAPGALIIDNPIGQASYHPFIVLMLEIARLKGVQPIFTTGVHDLPAVSEFPNVVRLRNSMTTSGERVIHQEEDAERVITHASITRTVQSSDITRPSLFSEGVAEVVGV
jgi:hypothetical protein